MRTDQRNYENIRRAIYRVLEWVYEDKTATKQQLCEVAMSELKAMSPTKAHAIIDTMVAMQYINAAMAEDGRSIEFVLTVYGTRLLNSFSDFYSS